MNNKVAALMLKNLLQRVQKLQEEARASFGIDLDVRMKAYSHRANNGGEASRTRQLFDLALAHEDGEYCEHETARWATVNDPEDEYCHWLTVFTDVPPSTAQLKKLAARKARKAREAKAKEAKR